MVSGDKAEAASGDLVDALLGQVVGRVAGLCSKGVIVSECGGSLFRSAGLTNLRANSYASAVSSSWRMREVCRSVDGRLIAEYASPVCEKVESSTPVMRTPRAAHEDTLPSAEAFELAMDQ